MTTTSTRSLGAVSVVGPLWGGDLLAAVRENQLHKDVAATVKPASYGLPKNADVETVTRAAWTTLKAAWVEFSAHHQDRVATTDDPWYGSDSFTWETWTRHLLDALGYHPVQATGGLTVDDAETDDPDDTYPVTHLHDGQVPVHAVPAGAPLSSRSRNVAGAARQSPHSTVQEYLNRTDAHLWAVLTNGLTLRLLRDNAAMSRQAYVEYDLAAIFDEGDYPTFALLWRTAHATRFTHDTDQLPTACVAETWQDHATKAGVAALDDLRAGVEHAIATLGGALVRHPANNTLRDALADPDDPFDATAMYRELLYVVYRHVFWFVLDDRNLLHPDDTDPAVVDLYRQGYSSDVLRDKARRHRGGNHPDGWSHHRLVASWFADPDGQPTLGIPGLLGHLWSPDVTAHLNDTTVDNRAYYETVRALSYVERDGALRRINYDVMGSEELGAVYESLLEVVPDVDVPTRTFTADPTPGNERKTTGSFYTPTPLINVLLDDALDPVIERAVNDALAALPDDAPPSERRDATEQAILNLTVCDPAMGSAHFLVAAGWRLAKGLAKVRTGETEPSPDAVQQALRDVASRCLYGVDVNPMAVELAKVAIWLETHVPGQPLTFLDHHLKTGNSLLGVGFDRTLIDWHPTASKAAEQGGVPDDAFKKLHGDDAKARTALMEANKARRGGQLTLDMSANWHDDPTDVLADKALGISFVDDTTPEGLAAKEQAWMVYGTTDAYLREKLRADAWTATWTVPNTAEQAAAADQPFDLYYDCHYNGLPAPHRDGVVATRQEAARHRFFHWYLEFPEVAQAGGFACLLGNPPWERIKLQTEEWFAAQGRDDIANAPRASVRSRMIADLVHGDEADQRLVLRWDDAQRTAAALSQFIRAGGRFPHGGVGDVNLYAVFADHFLASHQADGAAGFICPSGLATGATYAPFFSHLVTRGRLKSFYGFENEALVFPEVHHETKFALVTFHHGDPGTPMAFTGFARGADELSDPSVRYELSAADIRAINPNTLTAPLFRLTRSAEVTARIHREQPVLVDDTLAAGDADHNPWNVKFLSMFHMANDSGLFLTPDDLTERSAILDGNVATEPGGKRLLPLYEGKMFWVWDHRYGTYDGQTDANARQGVVPHTTDDQKVQADFTVAPRYWIPAHLVRDQVAAKDWDKDWLLMFRDIGSFERTFVPTVAPVVAAGNKAPLLLPTTAEPTLFAAMASSFVIDFAMRQSTDGRSRTFFIVKQAPVLRPTVATAPCIWDTGTTVGDWVRPRVAELTYTAHDLAGWAADIGHAGAPFRWDPDRRPVLQAELDAAMFHLYGLDRDDVEFVLDSFDVLRKYEEKTPAKGGYEEFRTKRLVLERYDAMAKAAATGDPYQCPLDVPPADPAMRHH